VIAVDLRGHGASPRGEYSPAAWSDDLVDTLPDRIDIAIAHSLGTIALGGAVDRLNLARAVYVEPPTRVD
jgi:pimeloyl-ACP methyl ester carboxylesterase